MLYILIFGFIVLPLFEALFIYIISQLFKKNVSIEENEMELKALFVYFFLKERKREDDEA